MRQKKRKNILRTIRNSLNILLQGMDEYNEQRVWEILVDTANEHSAQFFYLAPKYPHGISFEARSMHIHVCFNGKVDLGEDDNFLDVNDVIQRMKRRKTNGEAN